MARTADYLGFQVHVAAPGNFNAVIQLEQEGIAFHNLSLGGQGRHWLHEFLALWSLYKLCAQLRPSVVQLITHTSLPLGGLAVRLARVPALIQTVSTTAHLPPRPAGFWPHLKWRLMKPFVRMALNHPNTRIVFHNDDDRRGFIEAGLLDASDAIVIHGPGVDPDKLTPGPHRDNPPTVLFAGPLLRTQGVLEYIEAARILSDKGINARFVLMGRADAQSKPDEEVEQVLHDCQTSEAIVSDWHSDVADTLPSVDIVCLPAYRESLPLILVEAAACACAIVTTDVAGCREVVRDGKNGLLVPPRDATALAGALQRLIDDPVLRQRMGEAGRERVMDAFNHQRIAQRYESTYRELTRKE